MEQITIGIRDLVIVFIQEVVVVVKNLLGGVELVIIGIRILVRVITLDVRSQQRVVEKEVGGIFIVAAVSLSTVVLPQRAVAMISIGILMIVLVEHPASVQLAVVQT